MCEHGLAERIELLPGSTHRGFRVLAREHRHTAVFTGNALCGTAHENAVPQTGIHTPTNLSIVGYDYDTRAWRTGLAQAGFPVGLLLANLAFLLSSGLGGTWTWRVPFLLSAVLVLVGIVVRMKITESPEFAELKESGARARNPI